MAIFGSALLIATCNIRSAPARDYSSPWRYRLLCILLLAVLFPAALRAQSDTGGSVSGQVIDQSGYATSSALVVIANNATGVQNEVLSDPQGNFRFAELAPGSYTLRVEARGFAVWEADNIAVAVGTVRRITADLSLLAIHQTVLVDADSSEPAETPSPAVTDNISQEQIEDLPSNGRHWSTFVLLTPGVTSDANADGSLSFRGMSPLLNNNTVDGADNNQAFFSQERGIIGNGYSIAQGAVREFQVNTSNFSAEYGRASGGVINTVTKSGTNELHGRLFGFDRDAAWGAANPFTALTTQTASGFAADPYKPQDLRQQWGASIGGPIRHDHLFWFFAYDQLHHNFPGVAVASEPATFFATPTAQQLQTLWSRVSTGTSPIVTGCIAANTGDPALEGGCAYNAVLAGLNTLLGSVPRHADQLILFPKLDWHPNDRSHITLQYDRMRWSSPNGVETRPAEAWGIASFGSSYTRVDAGVARWQYFLTSDLLNDLRYQYGRDFEQQLGNTPSSFEAPFAQNAYGRPPQISVAGSSSGFRFGKPAFLDRLAWPDERRWQISDAVTWVRGHHDIKAGYDYNHVNDYSSGLSDQTGTYDYSSALTFAADYLSPGHCDDTTSGSGLLPCWSYYSQAIGPSIFQFQSADYAAFVADEWKLFHGLTLSLGVRYEYERLPNPGTALANPDIPQTALLPHDRNNFGPRAGFAWDIFGKGRTVLRGGYGIYYARIINATALSALARTGSSGGQRSYYFRPLNTGAPPFPYVFSSNPVSLVPPAAVFFQKHFQNPEVDQAELSLEQTIGRTTHLALTWMGSFGRELPSFVDTNIDTGSIGAMHYTVKDPTGKGPLHETYTDKFFYARLNPAYQQITAITSESNSIYQAAVLRLDTRISRLLDLHSSYTFAHAIDDGQNESTSADTNDILDPTNLRLERGTSNFDVRQRLVGGFVLHSPWRARGFAALFINGYSLASSGELRSGLPYSMRITGAIPVSFCSPQDYVSMQSQCIFAPNQGTILSPESAYGVSGLGASLNGSGGSNWIPEVGRNTWRYPRISNLDLRMSKSTRVTERISFDLLAEAFNVLNHENVTSVDTTGYILDNNRDQTNSGTLTFLSGANGKASFGSITNANSATLYRERQIQAGIKLIF
ncbi:TonB-dependent receptor [Paracidobacterium acidisoli]|uniref:TonB-dependent receptor-like beta-barrel domain-containing protein n=1 Tax=Paracidobacterium acidisoli TaxID=2303751 RepID=A0A372IML8_9BACT|nr:carboxypeptidase regulatory-like domain-containing protein [Paracidobacterium acidisoli]MBT9331779.1 TonB-dependent receptor [Paracidobacterium acidisoli]